MLQLLHSRDQFLICSYNLGSFWLHCRFLESITFCGKWYLKSPRHADNTSASLDKVMLIFYTNGSNDVIIIVVLDIIGDASNLLWYMLLIIMLQSYKSKIQNTLSYDV